MCTLYAQFYSPSLLVTRETEMFTKKLNYIFKKNKIANWRIIRNIFDFQTLKIIPLINTIVKYFVEKKRSYFMLILYVDKGFNLLSFIF